MKNDLLFDFTTDKANKKLEVKREFASDVAKVWKAWTTPEILDQWWAPKPWKAVTQSMDFTPGGAWLYYMEGPEGERHYCRADYNSITEEQNFNGLDAFCDEQGKVNENLPRTNWDVSFSQQGDKTLVHVINSFEKLEDLEGIIQMGFKEGFSMALGNLDEILEK